MLPAPILSPCDEHELTVGPDGTCRVCRPCMVPPPAPLLDRVVLAMLTRYPGVEVKAVVVGPEDTGRSETLVTLYVERDAGRQWRRCIDAAGATYELAVEDLATLAGVQ